MAADTSRLRLYDDLAPWWPLVSPPEEYEEEATCYGDALMKHARGPVGTVLELGSGGGSNARWFRTRFDLTLVEPSAGMRAISGRLNPGVEHVAGDMRAVRLGRTFDAVFIHDAVDYMVTREDLRRAMATAFAHCRPGGVALFAPDHVRDTFAPSTSHGGHDGADGRAARYLEWTHDPDPSDDTVTTHYAVLLREADGTTRVVHDRHVTGRFSRSIWLEILAGVGFEPHLVPFQHSDVESGLEVFVGRRPPA